MRVTLTPAPAWSEWSLLPASPCEADATMQLIQWYHENQMSRYINQLLIYQISNHWSGKQLMVYIYYFFTRNIWILLNTKTHCEKLQKFIVVQSHPRGTGGKSEQRSMQKARWICPKNQWSLFFLDLRLLPPHPCSTPAYLKNICIYNIIHEMYVNKYMYIYNSITQNIYINKTKKYVYSIHILIFCMYTNSFSYEFPATPPIFLDLARLGC